VLANARLVRQNGIANSLQTFDRATEAILGGITIPIQFSFMFVAKVGQTSWHR